MASYPTPPPLPAKRGAKQLPADRFIERQLGRTQTQVKLIDLAAALMLLAVGLLVYFLVLALIDHWLFDLGFWGRLLALGMLVWGAGFHIWTRIVPLLTHRINPVYAARAIEQTEPTLKNSLINLLTFKTQRSNANDLVYRALQVKAATDLTRVPPDTVVDRSHVIRVGYVLAGVLVIAALYTVLSPKNPLQTVTRVAAPWSDVARPTRVSILDVQPGDVTLFRGQTLELAAQLQGVQSSDQVSVYYSTLDQQLVEQQVPMQLDSARLWHECAIPPNGTGCQQDLVYQIRAGDAVSSTYHVTVSPAPTIVVESIEYEFPSYTSRPDQLIKGQADIEAVEGTRVTVRARANQPIRSARLEFDPGRKRSAVDRNAAAAADRLPMEFQDRTAWCSFRLALDANQRQPVHESYQLSFVTRDGHDSQRPNVHRIEVIPDFGPEIEVLTPTRSRTEVPADARQQIEIRAVDPDFGLKRIKLRAVAGNSQLLNLVLFEQAGGQTGQTMVEHAFDPQRLGLQAGDRVTFWSVAEDNRLAAGGEAAPNTERTPNYELIIVAPARAQAEPDSQPSRAADSQSPDSQPPDAEEGASGQGGQDSPAAGAAGGSSAEDTDAGGDRQTGAGGTASAPAESSERGEEQTGDGGSADGSPAEGGQQEDGPRSGHEGASAEGTGGADSAARREPLHDGEVFEKALERLQELEADAADPSGDQSGSGRPGEERSEGGGNSRSTAGNSGPEQGSAGGQEGTTLKDPNAAAADAQRPDESGRADSETGGGPEQPDRNQGAGEQRPGAPGEGGASQRNGLEQNRGKKPDVAGQRDMREKDPGGGDNGASGAGENSRDTTGSGSVESSQERPVENQDRRKTGNPDTAEPQPPGDPGTTNSRRQSDTEGAASGDQSGGGQKGSGQGANQAGNDSAGGNSSSDDGAGAAQESGVGETADAAGQKQRASGETGSTGTEQGPGSGKQRDPRGNRDGGQPGSGSPATQQKVPDGSPSTGEGTLGSGPPRGGGQPPGRPARQQSDQLDVPEGDAANLEYAQRATDLVLDHLQDQQHNPDQELLDELGWSADDLRAFLAKWQQLQRAARENPAGRRVLDERLRGLGLRPRQDRMRQGRTTDDRVRGLAESADESAPPPLYLRQFKAFKKSGQP